VRIAWLWLLVTFLGSARPPVILLPSDPLPLPDSQGNYARSSCHPYWIVLVDQLNGQIRPVFVK
jgi:hypothetical protein